MPKANVIFSSTITIFLLLSISHFPGALSQFDKECTPEYDNTCTDKNKAFNLKLVAVFTILVTSLIGVCLPLFARSVSAFQPERSLFLIVKSFASGIILATGFIHVLPDSFEMLSSHCLNDNPWHKFPFTGFVALISAVFTLMVDSITTSLISKSGKRDPCADVASAGSPDEEMGHVSHYGHGLHHSNGKELGSNLQLLRYRAEYGWAKKAVMAFFFSVTTPFGVVLGMALSKTYKENGPDSLITVGLLNASSSGLLIYMALVDLLAADFMGQKMQRSIKLQLKSYAAVLLGAGGMAVLAKWT
ncbi:hypothetical protein YC2023_099497 [Brassica napus]